jgi:hypothetical protein
VASRCRARGPGNDPARVVVETRGSSSALLMLSRTRLGRVLVERIDGRGALACRRWCAPLRGQPDGLRSEFPPMPLSGHAGLRAHVSWRCLSHGFPEPNGGWDTCDPAAGEPEVAWPPIARRARWLAHRTDKPRSPRVSRGRTRCPRDPA